MKLYMATGHLGTVHHGLKHPRKDLLERCGRKSAQRIFRDGKNGEPIPVGYVVAGEWFEIFEVSPWGRACDA
jgi:hypothetical protein